MKKLVVLSALLLAAFFGIAQTTPFSIGETFEMTSEVLGESRTINMYLPNNYTQDSVQKCNVIYLLDASANEDFVHVAGLLQFFELMFALPPTIIVGIANVDRKRDFTFHTDNKQLKEYYPTSGKSAPFIQFIKEELIPYIDSHYKAGGTKTLSGQSLGGLLAAEMLLKHTSTFDEYWITSPSMWWDDESMLNQVTPLFEKQPDRPLNVFIAVGKEGRIMKRGAKGLYKGIKKTGKKNLTVDYLYLPKENHATILHNSLYQALLRRVMK